MNKAGTESSPLTRGVDMLYRLAANVQLKTQDHDLALAILDCADRLGQLVNEQPKDNE